MANELKNRAERVLWEYTGLLPIERKSGYAERAFDLIKDQQARIDELEALQGLLDKQINTNKG